MLTTDYFLVVLVCLFGHDRRNLEVFSRRRRRGLPLEACRIPRIRPRDLPVLQRPEEVERRKDVGEGEDRRSGRRRYVENLELGRIRVVAARDAHVSEDELREEGQVEPDEHENRREAREAFRIETARHLRPPEVDTSEVG